MSLGNPIAGTASDDWYSQYETDIEASLQRLGDNTSQSIDAKDVRDAIWSINNRVLNINNVVSGTSSLNLRSFNTYPVDYLSPFQMNIFTASLLDTISEDYQIIGTGQIFTSSNVYTSESQFSQYSGITSSCTIINGGVAISNDVVFPIDYKLLTYLQTSGTFSHNYSISSYAPRSIADYQYTFSPSGATSSVQYRHRFRSTTIDGDSYTSVDVRFDGSWTYSTKNI